MKEFLNMTFEETTSEKWEKVLLEKQSSGNYFGNVVILYEMECSINHIYVFINIFCTLLQIVSYFFIVTCISLGIAKQRLI